MPQPGRGGWRQGCRSPGTGRAGPEEEEESAGMAAPAALQRSVVSPAGRHTASLIFLHGSGACFPSLLSPLPPGSG